MRRVNRMMLGIPIASTLVVFGVLSSLRPTAAPVQVHTDVPLRWEDMVQAAYSSTTVEHVPLPSEVRGLYWTGYTAAGSREPELLSYALASHLNAVVIDVKLDDGELTFEPNNPDLKPYAPKHPPIKDIDALLSSLKDHGMYRIARIFVMRDGTFGRLHPELALRTKGGGVWRDKTGTPWLDPAAPEVADYAVALAREAYARGFDEVQFDYVRFASDGALSSIVYPVYNSTAETKAEVMQRFFRKVGGTLKSEHIPVSFDLFGITLWSTGDYNIGQRLNDAFPNADHISPMVYPSHYPVGFKGYQNPALYPYDIIKKSLDQGVETLKAGLVLTDVTSSRPVFRPWIQDFDLGANYDAAKIEAEIKAARDAGASGFLIWNARNVYTPMTYN